jgi:CspA family cold shock protein
LSGGLDANSVTAARRVSDLDHHFAELPPLSCFDANRIVRGLNSLETEMPTGTVKWFNPTKGYGFIQPSGGGGKDVFVHISAVEQAGLSSLNDGQAIEYEIEDNRGRQSAVNLKIK